MVEVEAGVLSRAPEIVLQTTLGGVTIAMKTNFGSVKSNSQYVLHLPVTGSHKGAESLEISPL